MKTRSLILLIPLILLFGCKQRRPEPNFYKNLFTEDILTKSEFKEFHNNLRGSILDTIKKTGDEDSTMLHIQFYFHKLMIANDSIIQPFDYDIRSGKEYIVRAHSYEKIGKTIPSHIFQTIDGDSVQIGGIQEKPTLINLWFTSCSGCINEMSALNRLREKYMDKINFIAITFESEQDVLKFLKRREFNFKHVVDAKDFITEIGTKSYPENIFIDRSGCIKYIEKGVPTYKGLDLDFTTKHFESIIEDLLNE